MQVLVVLCLILFVLCLPVRLILGLCCGIKLQPPQRERDGDEAEPDQDTDPVIINIHPPMLWWTAGTLRGESLLTSPSTHLLPILA